MRLKCLAIFAAFTAPLSAQVWTMQGPAPRHSHSAVWVPAASEMIIFGGQALNGAAADLNDVWFGTASSSKSDSFIQSFPTGTLPPGRYGHLAAYDATTDHMMIFGGAEGSPAPCGNDVWTLAGASGAHGNASWTQENPSGATPTARVYHAGAYDPNTNTLIVFGGNNCSNGYFNDVWVLSNANGVGGAPTWTELNPSGTPPAARESATAIYDSTNNILTIYGGDAAGTVFGDVWVLSNANGNGGTPVWEQLTPSGTPPQARTGHTATYDPSTNRMTIFAGTNGLQTLSDTWVLTSANGIGTPGWASIKVFGTSPSLAYHSAVYNPALNYTYAFGGSSSADKLQTQSHAFTLTAGNGILGTGIQWILAGPPVRYSTSVFYDPATNALFVWGGQHAKTNNDFHDYWEATNLVGFSTLAWTSLKTQGQVPSARFGHTGLYDSGSNRMMVFGGAAGYPAPCVNDYHILQNANTKGGTPNFISVTPSGNLPAARTLHSSVYDSGTNRLIIFGGYNCSSTYFNDVWVLQNANDVGGQPTWMQLFPTGRLPSARESASAVYDPTTNTLIIYAGDAGQSAFSDIWVLSNANGSGGTPAWTQLRPSGTAPVARTGQTAIYDPSSNRMTIYGGYAGTKVFSDAWILTGANGQQGTPTWAQTTSGQPRRYHSSLYDPNTNEMITYGGSTNFNPLNPTSDIWTLSNANGLP